MERTLENLEKIQMNSPVRRLSVLLGPELRADLAIGCGGIPLVDRGSLRVISEVRHPERQPERHPAQTSSSKQLSQTSEHQYVHAQKMF